MKQLESVVMAWDEDRWIARGEHGLRAEGRTVDEAVRLLQVAARMAGVDVTGWDAVADESVKGGAV